MVRTPDKDKERGQDMEHKPVPDMVMDKAPGKSKVLDKVLGSAHTLDTETALEKVSELAPAPALSMYILLTADLNIVCHLPTDSTNYLCHCKEIHYSQLLRQMSLSDSMHPASQKHSPVSNYWHLCKKTLYLVPHILFGLKLN